MKTLTEFIVKKHQIQKEVEINYHPTTWADLADTIIELLKKNTYNLNCIDTSVIRNMSCLFNLEFGGVTLSDEQQKRIDISEWDVSNVKSMSYMFYGCEHFNGDLSDWDTAKVNDMEEMFSHCYEFNQDLSSWDVDDVINMKGIFYACRSLKNKPKWCKE